MLKDEIEQKLQQLKESNPDILAYRNSIRRKWRRAAKVYDIFDCIEVTSATEITPETIAFLYVLLDRYDDLLTNEVAPLIRSQPVSRFGDEFGGGWPDPARDLDFGWVRIDDVDEGLWELCLEAVLQSIHLKFVQWKAAHIGYTT